VPPGRPRILAGPFRQTETAGYGIPLALASVSLILDIVKPEKRTHRGGRGRTAALAAGVAAVTALGALAAAGPVTVPPSTRYHLVSDQGVSSAVASQSGITGGALFGGTFSLVNEESNLGRKLAVVRIYLFIGDNFPGSKYAGALAAGSTALVSLDSAKFSYASIAAGEHDAAIEKFLTQVNQAAIAYNLPAIYFTFQHEPDSDHHRFLGTPAQFVQAWDHVHALAQSMHLDWNDGGRVHWVFILIHNTYSNGRVALFWPGASEVDLVAADGYNSGGCRAASAGGKVVEATPSGLFNPLLNFAANHGHIPVFIAEWGSDTIPAGAQPTFIQQMQAYVTAHPTIVAASYWNLKQATCDYQINSNPASVSALATMGQSAAMQGHITG